MPACRKRGRELLCLKLFSPYISARLRDDQIFESPQIDVSNDAALYGETVSTARTSPHDDVHLTLQPLPFFLERHKQRSYWGFSALLCIDHRVVEEIFVDWDEEEPRNRRKGKTGWKFKSITPVPLQTISVGFFAYPKDKDDRKLFKPKLMSVLVVRLIDQYSGGSGVKPTMEISHQSYQRQPKHLRGHPFFEDRHPTPKGPPNHSSINHQRSNSDRFLAQSSGSREDNDGNRSRKRKVSITPPFIDVRKSKRRITEESANLESRLGGFKGENLNLLVQREEVELKLLEEELEIRERRVEIFREQVRLLNDEA